MKTWIIAAAALGLAPLAVAQGFGNVTADAPSSIAPFQKTWSPGGYANVADILVLSDGTIAVTGEQGFLQRIAAEMTGAQKQAGALYARFGPGGQSLDSTYFTSASGVLGQFRGVSLSQADNGDVFMTAYEDSSDTIEPVLLRLTQEGEEIWRKKLAGPPNQAPYDFLPTADGGGILFSATRRANPRQKIDRKTWIAKLSANGDIEGQSIFDGTSTGVVKTAEGGYLVAINAEILKLDASGREVSREDFSKRGDRMSVVLLADCPVGAATTSLTLRKGGGFFTDVIGVSASGTETWSHKLDFGYATSISGLACQEDGTVVAVGAYKKSQSSSNLAYIASVAADGSSHTVNTFSRTDDHFLTAVTPLASDFVLAGGRVNERLQKDTGNNHFFTSDAWLMAQPIE